MKIVIRVDASIHIGSGHVMRCLVLADAFKQQGHTVQFVMRPQQGDMFDFVERRGFKTLSLPMVPSIEPSHSADYQAWLQVSVNEDAQGFISLVSSSDIVLIDHYGVTVEWEKRIAAGLNCKLIVIDDLVRPHCADVIIDQTLGRQADEYRDSRAVTVLTGVKYALLNKRFSALHHQQNLVTQEIVNHKLLITMGGIDKPNATLKVLKALKGNLPDAMSVTVLLSPKAFNYAEVSAYCDEENSWINHIDFVDDMAAAMQQHTLAIGAPGSTSWERACLGLPSIVIPLADNQKHICQSLVKYKLSLSVKLEEIDTLLLPIFKQLTDEYTAMRKRNLRTCDGKGVERVMESIMQLLRLPI